MEIKGIGASSGVAIAKVLKLEEPKLEITNAKIDDPQAEIKKLDAALEVSIKQIEGVKEFASKSLSEEELAIFDAHILVLKDPDLLSQVKTQIETDKMNATFAMQEKTDFFIQIFEGMTDNEYMQERAADIKDVRKRVLYNLNGLAIVDLTQIKEATIIAAEDLTPSETSQLDRNYVKGFATNIGGRTSHSAIMARSLEIPAVVGTKNILEKVSNGDTLIIDGDEGLIIINPSQDQITKYEKKQDEIAAYKQELLKLKDAKTETKDGHAFELVANIGTPKDIQGVIENGGEGVGLYRTEFLYMDSPQAPTEEQQYQAYKAVLEGMDNKPVVVRTLDVGGDKEIPYLKTDHEMNPFLGYRAIRLCLDQPELFRVQLRALLRASVHGNLKIMFPMISNLVEFRDAKALLLEEKQNLISEGHKVSDDFEVGIMVEIPSTAFIAHIFAKEVDFFSIGTNDLIQYTMAADRMNEKVSYLYQPYNPAILTAIKHVIDSAAKEGKWAGMCGEMAGDLRAVPILVGLGLHEFSMSATSILKARKLIRQLDFTKMQELASKALEQATQEDVEKLIDEYTK